MYYPWTILLRSLISFGLLALVITQIWLVPLITSEVVGQFPEISPLATPYAVTVIIGLACGELALVCVWSVTRQLDKQRFNSATTSRLLAIFAGCAALASALAFGLFLHLTLMHHAGGPGVLLITCAVLLCGGACFCLALCIRRGVTRHDNASNLRPLYPLAGD